MQADRDPSEDMLAVDIPESVLRQFVASVGHAVVIVDAARNVRWANDAARTMHLGSSQSRDERVALSRLQEALRLPETLEPGAVEIRMVTDVAFLRREALVMALDEGSLMISFLPADEPSHTATATPEARLSALLEHTYDIITVLEADGTIRYSNPAAGALTGIAGEQVNGSSAFDIVHPDDRDAAAVAFTDALEGRRSSTPVELRIAFGDGVYHSTEVFIENLLDNPHVEGLVVTVHDITPHRKHQEELLRSEQRLRSLVENLSDVIVVLDENLTVQYASPGIENFISAPAYTNLGESAFNDIHPDDVGRVFDQVQQLMLEPDASQRLELRLGSDKDGWRWVEVTAVNRLDDASVSGLVCTLRDISDRRAAGDELQLAYERERQAAMKLRELDRLKDEFLATVSHELRTPLTSIAGFTQVLLRGQVPPEQTLPLLERVNRSANDMTSMIENLLDFSRLQAGRVAIKKKRLHLPTEVGEIIDGLAHPLRGHVVKVDVPDCHVTADSAGIAHILRNLLVNAAKYSEPGTSITVSAQCDDDEAVVSVADQGIGIAADEQTAIFQHFYQADPGRTGRRGAGVGLNIARRYAQMQRGRLWLESAVGVGSTFSFSLPLAEP